MRIKGAAEIRRRWQVNKTHIGGPLAAYQVEGGVVSDGGRADAVQVQAKRTHAAWHCAVREHQRDALDDHKPGARASSGQANDRAATSISNNVASGVGSGVAGAGDGGGGAVCATVNGKAAVRIVNG